MELAGRHVVVLGLGASGRAAARLALQQGARVTGLDLRTGLDPVDGIAMELGPHRPGAFLEADLVVVSPGVPASLEPLRAARESGVEVVGELALAASFLDAPMIAVTGTNGKSTVTWFTGQLLRAAGLEPFVGGNLGSPLSLAALEPGAHDVLVVEVSSYQMELPGAFHPRVAVVLNLTPDHLARHGDMETYGALKCRVFARMGPGDLAVIPAGDERLRRLAGAHPGTRAWLGDLPGVRRRGDRVRVELPGGLAADLDLGGVEVPGAHNRDNAATAALLALAAGAGPGAVQEGLSGLQALPHRMEVVAERDGVQWINDSKATNVEAAAVGIGGLDRPAVVLLGGEGKGASYDPLVPLLARHRAAVCFGEEGPVLAAALAAAAVPVHRVGTLAEAVVLARSLARPGDAVLLGPACASFDAFDNFEHRGRVFAALAREDT